MQHNNPTAGAPRKELTLPVPGNSLVLNHLVQTSAYALEGRDVDFPEGTKSVTLQRKMGGAIYCELDIAGALIAGTGSDAYEAAQSAIGKWTLRQIDGPLEDRAA